MKAFLLAAALALCAFGHAEAQEYSYRYYRDGNWTYYQNSYGTYGAQYYDPYSGVQRYDYRVPRLGYRVIGENHPAYPRAGYNWQRRMPYRYGN